MMERLPHQVVTYQAILEGNLVKYYQTHKKMMTMIHYS